jgi:V/A-type H+-transporting ATPase subunit F
VEYFVIGDEEIVIGFSFAGVKGAVVNSRDEALEEFEKAVNAGNILVLIITECVSMLIEDRVSEWQLKGSYPLLVEVPGIEGHIEGRKTILDSIKEAIGISV